jgi:hypothetical protein
MADGEMTIAVGGDVGGRAVGNGRGVGGMVGMVGDSLFRLEVVRLHAVRRLTNRKKITADFGLIIIS